MGGLKYIPLFHLSPHGTDKQRKANLQIARDPGPSVSQSNTTEDIEIITQGLPICQCRASSSPHTSSSAVWDRPHASRWPPRAGDKERAGVTAVLSPPFHFWRGSTGILSAISLRGFWLPVFLFNQTTYESFYTVKRCIKQSALKGLCFIWSRLTSFLCGVVQE